MRALVVCGNLFDLPTLTGPLKDAGFEVVTAPTGKQALKKLAAMVTSPKLILIDLETPGLQIAELSDAATEGSLVAYGPHVQRETLEAAAAAGCQVLTRGQLFRDIPQWIAAWS